MIAIIRFILKAGLLSPAIFVSLLCSCATRLDETPARPYSKAEQELIDIRRDIHRHPELSGEEKRTSRLVADYLLQQGLEVETGIGGYGVVGILKGDLPGPVVAYRADMDAMPSDLPDPVSFRSQVPGVRHFCGHDVHTTIALGVARDLAARRESLSGTVKFIFQPAEETGTGARELIEAGVLENPAPGAIFGLHVTNFEVGQIVYKEGQLMPGFDVLQVSLSGTRQLQAAARYYRRKITNVSTKNRSLEDFIQVQFFLDDYFPASHRWDLSCIIWTSGEGKHSAAKAEIEQILAENRFPDLSIEYTYTDQAVPGVTNDSALTRSSYDSIRSVFGEENIIFLDTMISRESGEDFSFYQQVIPGTFYFLGASNKAKGIDASPHTARFAVDEEVIFIGVNLMKRVLVDYLESQEYS